MNISQQYQSESDEFSLNVLYNTIFTFVNNFVKLSSEFWQHILNNYVKKVQWQHIVSIIKQNNTLKSVSNVIMLLYICVWDLLYYKNIEKSYQLCISSYLYREVFALTHNFMRHLEYVRMHEWFTDNLYLSDLSKHLYEYIHHCSQCTLIQTSQHSLYRFMQSILTSSQSFHILIINFILILLLLSSSDDYNTILSVTDKFSKTVIFISEWKIITAQNWVICLLDCLMLLNWDLLQVILSNKDHKFTAVL